MPTALALLLSAPSNRDGKFIGNSGLLLVCRNGSINRRPSQRVLCRFGWLLNEPAV
jgi:hypothetical protein